jgi:hypothetical protein
MLGFGERRRGMRPAVRAWCNHGLGMDPAEQQREIAMTMNIETTEMRELSVEELDAVSGAGFFKDVLGGWALGKLLDAVVDTITGPGPIQQVAKAIQDAKGGKPK